MTILRKPFAATLGAATIAALALAPITAQARQKLSGEEQLAKLLDGREAGKPVSCISMTASNDLQIIDKTALVYKMGSTYYVNRPSNAEQLDRDTMLVTQIYGNQLCRLDIVRMHDRGMPMMFEGFVALQDFVPYRKPKR